MIRITDFKGEIPRRNRTMLPQGFAEAATGARLTDGTLSPFRASASVQAVAAGTQAIFRHNGQWLSFTSYASAAQGPIADDRLYIMGDGAPRVRTTIETGSPATPQLFNLTLALDPPPFAPSVTAVNRQTDPTLNDPAAAIDITAYNAASGSTDASGVPHRLVFIRQPVAGISGKLLVTQPAILVLDVNNERCTTAGDFRVSIDIAAGFSGAVSGSLTLSPDNDGIVRFTDIKVTTGLPEDGTVLEAYASGIPPQTSDKFFLQADQSKLAKDIVFAYTYVTELDEESAPCLPSSPISWYPDLEIEVGDFSFPTTDRRINRIRIYRSETSASGVTDLYLVQEIELANPHGAEISVPGGVFTYLQENHPIAEILPSNDYDPPRDSYEGLTVMPNGMMAAFTGRELAFCEPYIPHAWPVKYRLTVDSDIMGLVAMGSALAVITKDKPYIVQGLHPDSMVMEKIDQSMPCVAKKSVVDLGYAAMFATHRGIAMIQGGSGASIITDALFSREQWRAFDPASIIATPYDGRYLFSYERVGETMRRTGVLDMTGETPFFYKIDMQAIAWFEDAASGELFYVPVGANEIRQWDAVGQSPIDYDWKSSVIRSNGYVNLGAMIVRTDSPVHAETVAGEIDVFADGQKVITITSFDTPERLPSGFLAQDWQFQAKGNASITEITVAGTISDLM